MQVRYESVTPHRLPHTNALRLEPHLETTVTDVIKLW